MARNEVVHNGAWIGVEAQARGGRTDSASPKARSNAGIVVEAFADLFKSPWANPETTWTAAQP